jgi:large subunit ribosomal protein L29
VNGPEIRDMTDDEIRDRIEQLQEERFRLRFRSATQQLENPMLLRNLRRDISRLKTVQRERELQNQGSTR